MERKQFIRPIAAAGFVFVIGLAVAACLQNVLAGLLAAALLLLAVLLIAVKPLRSPKLILVTIVTGLAFGCSFLITHFQYEPTLLLADKTVEISGTVTDVFRSSSGTPGVTVRLDRDITKTPLPVKVNLYINIDAELRIADRIETTAHFYTPSDQYGTYSTTSKADGIYLNGSVWNTAVTVTTDDNFHISRFLADFREGIKKTIGTLFSARDAGVFQAMLLGDKSALDDDTYRDFVHTGIIHVLVVSGLHLSILSQFVIRTLKLLHVRRKLRYAIGIGVVFCFMAIAGFHPAVNRAGLMLMLVYSGRLFNRESDSLTSLGLAGIVFTLFSPYLVLDIGFQLTYLSTLGILLFCSKMTSGILRLLHTENRFVAWIVGLFCVTLSVMVTTLPLTVYYFKAVPVLSPVFNVLISPLVTLILSGGIIAVLLAAFPLLSVVASVLAAGVSVLIKAVCGLASLCTAIPFSYLAVNERFVYFWMLATIILFGFVYAKCNFRRKYLFTASLSAVVLAVSVLTHALLYRETVNLSVCTIGEDSAVLIECEGRSVALGCNPIIKELGDRSRSQFDLVVEDDDLASVQALCKYTNVDFVFSSALIPEGSLSCRGVMEPTECTVTAGLPARIEVKRAGDGFVYLFQYHDINLIYGEYSEEFESFYQEGKQNIYILVNDSVPVFQKPVKYVIMLNTVKHAEDTPGVCLIDGTAQGISSLYISKDGAVGRKGADGWLY